MNDREWSVFVESLRSTLRRASAELVRVSDAAAGLRPAPGKWSKKEIVGHLVDSASNNHQRFVRARFQQDLVFAGYDQDAWVAAQQYASAPWAELVELWKDYNLHLARVMAATPIEVRTRAHERHNLHDVAFKTLPANEPATLEWFMCDYVDHLEHHLEQAGLSRES